MYALPSPGAAKPVGTFEFIVAEAGDQVDPAINGQFVTYAGPGPAGDGLDVFLYDLQTGATQTIAGGAGDQDSPDVYLGTAIYRTPSGIVVESWKTNQVLRSPPAGGDGAVANPVVHSAVAAWEHRSDATGTDIVVSHYKSGATPYVLRAPGDGDPTGDQHSPSVYDDLVAYVDDARQGSVWLHDAAMGPSNWTRICEGGATGVSIGFDGARYVVAVARSSGTTGEDIEVYDRDGTLLAALPAAGPQRNPHVAGEWVAFDDHSGPVSQVVVWRWLTPPGESNLVFVPHPTDTEQRLNDAALALGDELRVVFEDTASAATGRDIALYRLPVNPLVFDGQPNGWPITTAKPADCDDPDQPALATLELTRATSKPHGASVTFEVEPGGTQVLVCFEAKHVSSAWVLLGDDPVARPGDFEPHVVKLSRSAWVDEGHGQLSGILEGKPGARLTVRVLADPARAPAGAAASAEPAPAAQAASPSGGCGNPGAFTSLASLAALLARRRRSV